MYKHQNISRIGNYLAVKMPTGVGVLKHFNMIEIKTKLRKWGNSLGVVVPWKAANEAKAKEGEEVVIFLKKEKDNVLREMFGSYKFKKPTEKLMKELDKELYND